MCSHELETQECQAGLGLCNALIPLLLHSWEGVNGVGLMFGEEGTSATANIFTDLLVCKSVCSFKCK